MTDLEWLAQEAQDLWQERENLSPELIRVSLKRAYDQGRVDGRNAAPDRLIKRFLGEEEPCST